MVEVYINELKSLTTRVYPTKRNSKEISLYGKDELLVESLQIWSMNGVY